MEFTYYDEATNRLRYVSNGRFAPFEDLTPQPDEECSNGCVRFGDWWVPEDCATHLGADS